MILIDRVTNMTSACGVITYVKQDKDEQKNRKVGRETRAALNGQIPITVEFREEKGGFTRSFVENVEHRLISEGKHTYLYAPRQDEAYADTVRHLIDAGIIVLLFLDRNTAVSLPLRNESYYYYGWKKENVPEVEDAVAWVKKQSSYSTYISGNGDYNI